MMNLYQVARKIGAAITTEMVSPVVAHGLVGSRTDAFELI